MKLNLLLILGAFVTIPSALSDVHCSDAEGKIAYVEKVYSGGAAPFPGMILKQVQLFSEGSLVSESVYRQPGEDESIPKDTVGPIETHFSKISILFESADPTRVETTYSAFVGFFYSEKEVPLPESRFMICKSVQEIRP